MLDVQIYHRPILYLHFLISYEAIDNPTSEFHLHLKVKRKLQCVRTQIMHC
jgi:hypothetical protein